MSTFPLKVDRLEAGHKAILEDFDEKHMANEKKWDSFSKRLDEIMDKITNIRVDNARWGLGTGALTAIVIEIVRHAWPK